MNLAIEETPNPGADAARDFTGGGQQVWVRHRTSGDVTFLPDGMQATLDTAGRRAFTRDYACVVPSCTEPIIVRGGTKKRTHYAHLRLSAHSNESADHHAAKHMLAQWASTQPGITSSGVERDVRGPDWQRRVDAYATQGDRLIAFEVEYKAFPADDWATKHDQLTSASTPVTWLIGHSRLHARDDGTVKLTPMARALAERGMHVLAINPHQRTIATLSDAHNPTRKLTAHSQRAHLTIDPIDTCTIDAHGHLTTPTMRHLNTTEAQALAEAEAQRVRDERERAAQQRAEWDRRAAERARDARRAARMTKWKRSPTRDKLRGTFGEIPPAFFDTIAADDAIDAEPVHWHADVYFHYVHDADPAHPFTTHAVTEWVAARHGLNPSTRESAYMAVWALLQRFRDGGLLRPAAPKTWTPTKNLPISPRVRLRQENNRRQAAHHAWGTQQADREHRASKLRETTWALAVAEWEDSADRVFFRDRVCGGVLPRAVTWEGDLHAARVAFPTVAPQKWRAIVWSRFVYATQPGREFTNGDVVTCLNMHAIPTRGPAGSADRAVRGYLTNLTQRGLLTVVQPGVWSRTDMSWRHH